MTRARSQAIFSLFAALCVAFAPLQSWAQNFDVAPSFVESTDPVNANTNFTYTISIANSGPSSAPGVSLITVIPQGVTFVGFNSISQGSAIYVSGSNTITLNFGTLNSQASANLVFSLKADAAFKAPSIFTVTSPGDIARDYHTRSVSFAPKILGTGPSSQLLAADDGNGETSDACQDLVPANAASMNGKIALIRNSGICTIEVAANRVAAAGASGVIVVQSAFNLNITGSPNITVNIPVAAITKEDGDSIFAALQNGAVQGNFTLPVAQFLMTGKVTTSAGIDTVPSNNIEVEFTTVLVDSDGDGIPDTQDTCPNLPGAPQDDFDQDGLGDVCDPCTDRDSDGFGDAGFPFNICPADQCEADSDKSVPGACGCGTADVDDDKDGTLSCLEQCPQDAAKTAPGVCGCGNADADSNANGIVDCSVTPELRFTLNNALTQLAAIKAKNGRLRKKSKDALDAFKIALAGIDSAINTFLPAVQLADPTANLSSLNAALQAAGKKALKFRSPKFAKNKKGAAAAVNKIIAVLAL